MAITYRPTSTLSAAILDSDSAFNVASTANISVGDLLVFRNELMQVRDIPVAGRVVVRRGYEGTRAYAQKTGATFFIGSGDEFQAAHEHSLGIFGPGGKVPDICIPGVKGFDGNGYEYLLVDVAQTGGVVPGATVVISKDGLYTATVITSTSRGNVGITAEPGTSDQWVWVQRTGYVAHAKLVIGSSLATSLGEVQGATSVSTPSVGLLGRSSSQRSSNADTPIHGLYLVGAATTASTATCTSETGFYAPVWLEYPWMDPFSS